MHGQHPSPTSFCDGCGTPLPHLGKGHDGNRVVYASMPIDLGDVLAGESAVICHDCDSNIPDNYSI